MPIGIDEFVDDVRSQWAVEMGLIRIAEAVNRIPTEVLACCEGQPWRSATTSPAAFPGLYASAIFAVEPGGTLKLLLTSAGVKNPSIHDALVDLLGKPIADSSALCIPTASYANPDGAAQAWKFVAGREPRTPMCELGWKSLGVLELAALPSLDEQQWVPAVQEADVLLVSGGDPMYLYHWMRQSGLADLLPSLSETVWVGLSAGSMVMTPRIGDDFVNWRPPTGGDSTLGIVDFSIFPHLDHEMLPENTMADAERWAAGIGGPTYAIDDETAIKVTDGTVDVVSEGHWRHFRS